MTLALATVNVLQQNQLKNLQGPVKIECTEPHVQKLRGTSLVVQWLRIHLPMQGTRAQALVQEDPTCHGATKPVHHNY